jgi:hypothetical protein
MLFFVGFAVLEQIHFGVVSLLLRIQKALFAALFNLVIACLSPIDMLQGLFAVAQILRNVNRI